MAVEAAFSKWSDAQQYIPTKPSWVPPAHQERVGAYRVYQEVYWTHITTQYRVMNRGLDADDQPVYVPSSRIVVDTLNRYIGPKLWFEVDTSTGTPDGTQLLAAQSFQALFDRERFASRYAAAKRDGIINGDWGWHITADPNKAQGTRISLVPFKAENYFPVFEDETVLGGDPDKLVMVVLAEEVLVGEDARVRVQRYDRRDGVNIFSSVEIWEPDKWFLWRYDDDNAEPVEVVLPPTPLPAGITSIPVYHVPNRPETGETFGTSPMRGLLGLQAALNQSNTDEDLAMALMGLGVYATDEPGGPVNERGESVSWMIYPGAVIQNSKGLRKVEGLTGLQAYTDHIGRLEGYYADATGATDAARGRLEVQEAESGVALQLRLGPTLALAEDQDTILLDVHRQIFYDLVQMWFPAIEGLNFTDVRVMPVLGDKLPVNRAAEVTMVNELVVTGVLSKGSARQYLASKGFTGLFDADEGALVLAEKVAEAAADMGDTSLEDREGGELNGGEPSE